MKPIHIMAFILACVSALGRNIEPLSPDEEGVVSKLEALQWRAALSSNETALVANSLVSPKDTIAEAALCVAAAHDFRDLREHLQRGVGPANGYSRLLANIIANGLENRQQPIESLRRNHLLEIVPPDAMDQLGQKAGHIAAVLTAKTLRNGVSSNIAPNEFTFSSFDQKLLLYSGYPAADAQRMIIQVLGRATVAGADEYDLIRVLASYDNLAVDSVLATFDDEKTGEYGKLLMIRAVEKLASCFTDAEREKIKTAFGKHHSRSERIERALRQVSAELEKEGE